MEGNEGSPKRNLSQRIAEVPKFFRKAYSLFSVEQKDLADSEEDGPIEIEDVAWAVGALGDEGKIINTGGILKMLGVGKSEKIDYFKENPEEYSQVNRILQQLVDENILTRNSWQDKETGAVKIDYRVKNKDRIKELSGEGAVD